MRKHMIFAATSTLLAALLAGCGARQDAAPSAADAPARLLAAGASAGTSTSTSAAEVSHAPTVALLYLAYFGRPADPGGEANFSAQLRALGMPNSIEKLEQAYGVNAQVRTLVDSFANSAESSALYPALDQAGFVSAVYQSVLGRAPDLEGLRFWVGALERAELTRAKVAMSIGAAALKNSSAQGLLDGAALRKRVAFAVSVTAQLDALALADIYRGRRRRLRRGPRCTASAPRTRRMAWRARLATSSAV